MAQRCLISYQDRYQFLVSRAPDVPVPALSATGVPVTGFEPVKALDPRRSTWWQVPGGAATQTLTLAYATAYEPSDVVALFAPAGLDFTTPPRVRLRNNAGVTVFDSNVSVRPARGLPDQRFFVMPTRTTWRYLDVILAAGDALAYVRYGWAMNLTAFAGPLTRWMVNDSAVVQEGTSSAVFAAPDASASRRYLSYSIPLTGVPMVTIDRVQAFVDIPELGSLFDMWDQCGKSNPMIVLPHAEDNTSDATGITVMHSTGACARLTNDLEFGYDGFAPSTFDEAGTPITNQVLRSVNLSFEGAF